MREGEFNEHIRGRINENALPEDGGHPGMMEEDLTKERDRTSNGLSDDKIDELVKKEILEHETAYDNQHWTLLQKRLEEEKAMVRHIYLTKILEAVAFILILLTAYQLLRDHTGPNNSGQQFSDRITTVYENNMFSSDLKVDCTDRLLVGHIGAELAGSSNTARISRIRSSGIDRSDGNRSSFTTGDGGTDIISAGSTGRGIDQNQLFEKSLLSDTDEMSKPLSGNVVHREDGTMSDLKSGVRNVMDIKKIQRLSMVPLSSSISNVSISGPSPVLLPKKDAPEIFWHFAASYDMNHFNTSLQDLFLVREFGSDSKGLSVQAGYSQKNDKWEVEIGAGLSYKENLDDVIEHIDRMENKYLEKTLDKSAYVLLQLPLSIKYHVFHHGGWNLFTGIGTRFHVVVGSASDIDESIIEEERLTSSFVTNDSRLLKYADHTSFLEGGNLNNNIFFTGDFILGVQKSVSDMVTTFLETQYNHYILNKGIGRKNDQVNTTSFKIGAKFKL